MSVAQNLDSGKLTNLIGDWLVKPLTFSYLCTFYETYYEFIKFHRLNFHICVIYHISSDLSTNKIYASVRIFDLKNPAHINGKHFAAWKAQIYQKKHKCAKKSSLGPQHC